MQCVLYALTQVTVHDVVTEGEQCHLQGGQSAVLYTTVGSKPMTGRMEKNDLTSIGSLSHCTFLRTVGSCIVL